MMAMKKAMRKTAALVAAVPTMWKGQGHAEVPGHKNNEIEEVLVKDF